ncbi:MAG: PAS domain S-box protein, partial [Bdellovibrionales bacterium]|nr:PAS domain S-box protein [Oligoflexia bacterium]
MDEKLRLNALYKYDVLDTLDEAVFDDITKIASFICGTPIALISLVDENRQWIKAKIGMDIKETSRDVAFCAHTILQKDVLEVPDARLDSRFSENPAVTAESGFRFYAGTPLITPDGFAIGTVCVVDTQVKKLTPAQIELLAALGRQVVSLLELRLADKVRIEKERELARKHQHVEVIGSVARAANSDETPINIYRAAMGLICEIYESKIAQYIPVGKVLPKTLDGFFWFDYNKQNFENVKEDGPRFDSCALLVLRNQVVASGKCGWLALDPHLMTALPDVKSVLAVPVLAGERVAGLLEIYSALELAPDQHLSNLMNQTGIELGRVYERASSAEHYYFVEALLENIDIGVVACDANLQISLFNPMSRKLHGMTAMDGNPSEWAHCYSLYHKDGKTLLTQEEIPLFRAFKEGSIRNAEIVIAPEGLPAKHLSVNGRAFFDENGERLGAVVAMHDITELEQAASKLQESEQRLSMAIDASQMGIWDCDLITNQYSMSESCIKLFELSSHTTSWSFDDFLETVESEDRDKIRKAVKLALSKRQAFDVEYRISTPHSQQKWIQARGQVHVNESGKPVRMLGTVADITERKLSEEHLSSANQRWQALVSSAAVPIISVDTIGNVLLWNPAAEQTFGWSEIEVLGKPVPFVNSNDREASGKMLKRVLSGERLINVQLERERKDGSKIQISLSATPLYSATHEVNGIMVALTDVTDQYMLQESLRRSRNLAEEAVEVKSRFLANMSHEIRTPINGIIGMTDLILDMPLAEVQRDYAETIKSSADSLLTIVNDILDFSKLEAGKLLFDDYPFSPLVLINDVIKSLTAVALKKNLQVLLVANVEWPSGLKGDGGR